MSLLAIACLSVGGVLVAAGLGAWFARPSFVQSLGWLVAHLVALFAGHYLFGVHGFLLMFSLPLLLSVVLGGAAGRARPSSGSQLLRLAPLGASLPAVAVLNAAALLVHLDELGRPRGDNSLIYVFAQLVWGVPLQLLLLGASFGCAAWVRAFRARRGDAHV